MRLKGELVYEYEYDFLWLSFLGIINDRLYKGPKKIEYGDINFFYLLPQIIAVNITSQYNSVFDP